MKGEVIFVELNIYEKHLNDLLRKYENTHSKYISSISEHEKVKQDLLLVELNDINQQIISLVEEISNKIHKINNTDKYRKEIAIKNNKIKEIYHKIKIDENNIKKLLSETNDLDGINESLKIKQNSSMYINIIYIIVITILSFIFIRLLSTDETNPVENIILFLAILSLLYNFRSVIYSGSNKLLNTINNIGTRLGLRYLFVELFL